jgi:uncharacterized protein (DUF433 family)
LVDSKSARACAIQQTDSSLVGEPAAIGNVATLYFSGKFNLEKNGGFGIWYGMTAVANSLIELDDRGRAWIKDANTKVIEVAMDEVGHGWTAQEMHRQHPHLSLSQIHAALSYYHEHKTQFDAEISRDLEEDRRTHAEQADTPLTKRLRALGKIP